MILSYFNARDQSGTLTTYLEVTHYLKLELEPLLCHKDSIVFTNQTNKLSWYPSDNYTLTPKNRFLVHVLTCEGQRC